MIVYAFKCDFCGVVKREVMPEVNGKHCCGSPECSEKAKKLARPIMYAGKSLQHVPPPLWAGSPPRAEESP